MQEKQNAVNAVPVLDAVADPNQPWYNEASYQAKNYSLSRSNPGGVMGTFGHYTGLSAMYEGFFGRKAKDAQGRETGQLEVKPKVMETAFALFMLTLVIAALAPYLGPIFAAIQSGTAGLLGATGVVAPGMASVLGYGMASTIAVGTGALAIRGSLDTVQGLKETLVMAPLKAAGRFGAASREAVGVAMDSVDKKYSEYRDLDAKAARKEGAKIDKKATSAAKENLSHDKRFLNEVESLLKSGKATSTTLGALIERLNLQMDDLGKLNAKELAGLYSKVSRLGAVLEANGFSVAAGEMAGIKDALQDHYEVLDPVDKSDFVHKVKADFVTNDTLSQTNHVANDVARMVSTQERFDNVVSDMINDVVSLGEGLTAQEEASINAIDYDVAKQTDFSRVTGRLGAALKDVGVGTKAAANTNVAPPASEINDGVDRGARREVL